VNEWNFHAEQLPEVLFEPQAIVLPGGRLGFPARHVRCVIVRGTPRRRIPPLELHHQLHPLRCARRGDAEQIADVDDAEPAHLHMVPRQVGAGANQVALAAQPYFDSIVGDQPVAAYDQIERALALADAAVAGNQHAEAQNVDEHAVHDLADGQRVLQQRTDLGDGDRCGDGGTDQRHMVALAGGQQFRRRLPAAGDQHAGDVVRERRRQHADARRAVQAFEIPHLALAEDEDAARLQVFVETGEGEAGLLDVGTGDGALEAAAPAQQFQRQPDDVGPPLQQARDAERRRRDRHVTPYAPPRW
jgi:hypothetical protein